MGANGVAVLDGKSARADDGKALRSLAVVPLHSSGYFSSFRPFSDDSKVMCSLVTLGTSALVIVKYAPLPPMFM